MTDLTDISKLDIEISSSVPTLTLKQKQAIQSMTAFFKSPISMATLDTEIKISVDYFQYLQKSKSSICFSVVSFRKGLRTIETSTWCDVEIGARGGIVGKWDRIDPIKTSTRERF